MAPVETRVPVEVDTSPLWARSAPFGLPTLFQALGALLPSPMTVDESKDAFVISIDAPGVAPEDVTVNVSGRLVTIAAARRAASSSGRCASSGGFERTFALLPNATGEGASAALEDGVLTVTFPKVLVGVARAAAERMGIPVRSGGAPAAAPAAAEPSTTEPAAAEPAAAAAPAPAAPTARPPAEILADLARAVKEGAVQVKKAADGSVTFTFNDQ